MTYMNKFYLLILSGLLSAMSVSASNPATQTPIKIKMAEMNATRIPLESMQKAAKKATRASEYFDVTVKIDVTSKAYGLDLYFPFLAMGTASDGEIFYNQTEDFSSNPKGTTLTGHIMLPPGTYDFIGSFNHRNPEHNGGADHLAWYILENVEVKKNTTININPDESINHIQYKTVNPDGEESVLRTFQYIDEEYHAEVVDPGNISGMNIVNTLMNKEYGIIDYLSHTPQRTIPSEDIPFFNCGEAFMDVYVNDVSDRYEFRQVRQMRTDSGEAYITAMHRYGSPKGSEVTANTKEDYFLINTNFGPSFIDDLSIEDYDKKYILYFGATESNCMVPQGTTGAVKHDYPFTKVYASSGIKNGEAPLAVLQYDRVIVDRKSNAEFGDGSLWLFLTDAENSLYSVFPRGEFATGFDGQRPRQYGKWYPGHTGLSYTIKENPNGYQSTFPFISMSYMEDFSSSKKRTMMLFSYSLSNQAFESHSAKKEDVTVSIKYNSNEIYDGTSLDWTWPTKWASEDHDPGSYLFTVEDRSFSTDGINVSCIAQMSFDTKRKDYFPPIIQAFQSRNNNGLITNKFQSPSDGEFRIVAGDFNIKKTVPFDDGSYFAWYEYDPIDVTVEYAPHGSDTFTKLTELNKSDETYLGFGQYWKVPLAQIGQLNGGWYDVRLNVTDDAGNYQTHIMSPAFYIGEDSGVPTIEDGNANVSITNNALNIFGMDEPQVNIFDISGHNLYRGSGNYHSLEFLSKGIYVVKITDGINSKVIKFIKP